MIAIIPDNQSCGVAFRGGRRRESWKHRGKCETRGNFLQHGKWNKSASKSTPEMKTPTGNPIGGEFSKWWSWCERPTLFKQAQNSL